MSRFDFLRRDVKEVVGLKQKKAKADFIEQPVEVTINDVPPDLQNQIIDNYLSKFDITCLYIPDAPQSLIDKALPWITAVVSLITLFLVFRQ